MKRWWLVVLMALLVAPAQAQPDRCPAIVQAALTSAAGACAGLGRNQACYGNVTLTAEARPGAAPLIFEQPGDRVNVADVQRLRLSPFDRTAGTWGVALLKLQANLPETLPGQNITVLLFGNVELQAAPEPVSVAVTATTAVIVYDQPARGNRIVAGLIAGQTAVADGQTADQRWLRLRLPGNRTGWAAADLFSDPSSVLPVLDPALPAAPHDWKPMQAFYFRTGLQDAPCAAAPDSGILIQVPDSAGAVLLRMNDVDVILGSTAYFQAQPDGLLTISVLEGAAVVSAGGTTRAAPAGTRLTVPLDADLKAAAPPNPIEPYTVSRLVSLPVQGLDQPLEIAPPLPIGELAALSVPTAGEWWQVSTGLSVCENGVTREIFFANTPFIIDVQPDGFTVVNNVNLPPYNRLRLERASDNRYTADVYDEQGRPLWFYDYLVAAPDRIIGSISAFYYDPDCRDDLRRTIKLVQPDALPPPADSTTPPETG